MALPVVMTGMNWFAGVIGVIFASVFKYFAKFLTKKIAVRAAGLALIAASTVTFIGVITGLAHGLAVISPPWLSTAASLVVPDNTAACISLIITGRITRWVYEWNVRVIQYKLF
ncbi:hypothetical protein A3759_03795 [Thalassolituus sp. HI0120]|jgi:hypothetical protein|nr:hypothetical protein A3759_29385 [Thalassolituus sp. HI0120]KZZ49440.1 hypothetical protein A3759_03795 [Thalassolituus sp. HI0120]